MWGVVCGVVCVGSYEKAWQAILNGGYRAYREKEVEEHRRVKARLEIEDRQGEEGSSGSGDGQDDDDDDDAIFPSFLRGVIPHYSS